MKHYSEDITDDDKFEAKMEKIHKKLRMKMDKISLKVEEIKAKTEGIWPNKQKEGALKTAAKKNEDKELFYEQIFKPCWESGTRGIKNIIIALEKKQQCKMIKENIYEIKVGDRKIVKSKSCLEKWITKFKKRLKDHSKDA